MSQPLKNGFMTKLMASLKLLFPSIFLFSILISIKINCNSANPSNHACPSFSCGDGLVLRYPLWLQGQQTEPCGYPDLGISCIDEAPMLRLKDQPYRVVRQDHSQRTITFTYGEINDTICPIVPHDVMLNTTWGSLAYTSRVKMVKFFYNCTVYPTSEAESIKCLQVGAKHAYVFVDGLVPELDWKDSCESIVNVPMMGEAGIDLAPLASNFGKALKEGFDLKWQPNVEACTLCESSGGFCVHSRDARSKFSCSCNDGRRGANCNDKDVVSGKLKPNFLAIALLILGSLMTSLLVFYFIREKNGVHKRGFSQLPVTGK